MINAINEPKLHNSISLINCSISRHFFCKHWVNRLDIFIKRWTCCILREGKVDIPTLIMITCEWNKQSSGIGIKLSLQNNNVCFSNKFWPLKGLGHVLNSNDQGVFAKSQHINPSSALTGTGFSVRYDIRRTDWRVSIWFHHRCARITKANSAKNYTKSGSTTD